MAVDTVEKVIFSLLDNDETVDGLVGKRIYPGVIPQGKAVPAIVYEQTGGDRSHTFGGVVGYVDSAFDVTCWSSTYGGARTLSDAVRKVLDGHSGTTEAQKVYVMFLNNEVDQIEEDPTLLGRRRFGKRLSFGMIFKEATS